LCDAESWKVVWSGGSRGLGVRVVCGAGADAGAETGTDADTRTGAGIWTNRGR
jgi:hypothetical protein